MAKSIVGYKSPFKKASPMKIAPWLLAAGKWAATPQGMTTIGTALPGIIKGIGSLFGGRKRRREQKAANAELQAAKAAYMNMEFTNPLAGLQNPYAENLYEDLTVDTRAADYLKQQQQQQQANLMQGLKGAAGASGIAGLAQSMANIGAKQAQQASLQISEQERKNQLLALQGEQQKRKGAFDVDVAIRQAEQKYVTQKEQDRIADLYGLSIDRLSAADKARATARSGFISGIGSAAAGVAGTFMPGGVNYGAFTPGSMHPNQTIYDPVHGGPMSPNPDYDPTAPTGGLWPYTPTGS